MKKELSSVRINGDEITFKRAVLHVGSNNGITYILTINNPVGIREYPGQVKIDIQTSDSEKREIVGALGHIFNNKAIFYIVGEPFPVTQSELNRFL